MESETVQFMRRVVTVQPRFDNVAAALGALRQLRTGHQAFGTNVGAIESAVKLLADRTAAIVIALKGHPDQVRRRKTIGAWKDIVHARELQRTEPLAEASAPSIYRLPLALLQKIGESLETLQLLDDSAEVLRAFEKIAGSTAGLLWEVDEHNIGGALKAMRTRIDEIQGILDFVTSLMRQVMPSPWDPDIEKCEAQRRWALQTDPSSSSSSSWLLGDLSDADSSREVNLVLLHTDEGMLGNAHSDALKRAQNLENLRSAIMRKASARLRRKAAALRNEHAATPALSPTALEEAEARARVAEAKLLAMLDLEEPEAGAGERSGSAKGKGQGKAKGKVKRQTKGVGGKR